MPRVRMDTSHPRVTSSSANALPTNWVPPKTSARTKASLQSVPRAHDSAWQPLRFAKPKRSRSKRRDDFAAGKRPRIAGDARGDERSLTVQKLPQCCAVGRPANAAIPATGENSGRGRRSGSSGPSRNAPMQHSCDYCTRGAKPTANRDRPEPCAPSGAGRLSCGRSSRPLRAAPRRQGVHRAPPVRLMRGRRQPAPCSRLRGWARRARSPPEARRSRCGSASPAP